MKVTVKNKKKVKSDVGQVWKNNGDIFLMLKNDKVVCLSDSDMNNTLNHSDFSESNDADKYIGTIIEKITE